MTLDDETLDSFKKEGVAVLRGVFTDWMDSLGRGVDYNMENPGPFGKMYHDEETGGRFLSDYCNWDRIPEYKDFIFRSGVADVAGQLMGAETVRLFHEHVLVKEAATGIPTPWHQDQPYYCVEGPKTVSLWIPLDPIPKERCPEFIARSHKTGKLYRPQRFNGQALNENDGLEPVPDIDADRSAYDIRSWELALGDAIAFNYRTLHGAPPNTSKTAKRRAFSLRLVGDDCSFVRREGLVSSPPFPDVTLASGAALDGPEFPVLKG